MDNIKTAIEYCEQTLKEADHNWHLKEALSVILSKVKKLEEGEV